MSYLAVCYLYKNVLLLSNFFITYFRKRMLHIAYIDLKQQIKVCYILKLLTKMLKLFRNNEGSRRHGRRF